MNHHVLLAYKKLKDPPLINFAQGVHDALLANAGQFNDLPWSLADLQAAIDDFTTKLTAAHQGSVAQTGAKNAARRALLEALHPLASYVEGVALGRAEVIRAAGFAAKAHGHTPQTPLAKPAIFRAVNRDSTQVQLRVKAQRNVRAIKAQYRTAGGDWQDGGGFANTKAVIVERLVPGTLYDFRVQFIGGSTGTSDWSDAIKHMAV